VLFGSQPFTSALVMSNPKWFKYEWVWKKSKPNGWQHANNKPMKTTEDIHVFSAAAMGHESMLGENRMRYNPQGVTSAGINTVSAVKHGRTMGARPNQVGIVYEAFTGFPSNFLEYPNVIGEAAIHPTQKPIALLEYLIRTYTNEGDTVLDFAMGSGTTGCAAVKNGRNFIGIEMDAGYFAIAEERIKNAAGEIILTARERATGQMGLFGGDV
jgi:site-specific DNA-methyltransferase (adenine-specific)